MRALKNKPRTIAFFGHFNSTNFGNEATLQAILHRLRRLQPDAQFICISTDPAPVTTEQIKYIPISERFVKSWSPRNRFLRVVRKLCVGMPAEPYRWVKGLASLRRADVLIVPGTGLLTDAAGLGAYGPYNMFKWALIAKSCGCKLLFVSVGAGPVYSTLGRVLVRSALRLAEFRSYRDHSTWQYLRRIGFRADRDQVYPDLAFSLCETLTPSEVAKREGRPVVGLGLMTDAGRYGTATPGAGTHRAYLETLASFVKWLLAHGYDVRLFIGDLLDDRDVTREFRSLLTKELSAEDEDHIIDEPVATVEGLLSQIAKTDFVVATRFHGVVFGLLCNKPMISISFHHKCDSLMSTMGLAAYCLHINDLTIDRLIDRFDDLTKNEKHLKLMLGDRVSELRKALDEQYAVIRNYL